VNRKYVEDNSDLKETRKYYIYMHTCPNGMRYIGMTLNGHKRWSSIKKYAHNSRFYNDIIKYGWNNIKHDILAETYYGWLARKIEKDMILRYQNCCYNETNFSKSYKKIYKTKKDQDLPNNNVLL